MDKAKAFERHFICKTSTNTTGLPNLTCTIQCWMIYWWMMKPFKKPSRGLAVLYSTQTNMALGSRPIAGYWWSQEGHPVLSARAKTKVLSEAPSKPQGIGGNGGKIQRNQVKPFKKHPQLTHQLIHHYWRPGFQTQFTRDPLEAVAGCDLPRNASRTTP